MRRSWLAAVILGVLVIVGLGWVNYQYSVVNPGGNDFLVHYVGTRSYLREGLSPYSDETAIRIQTAAYGHPAEGEEHELRVAYPLYSIFLFTPFALIGNYVLARAVWMTLLEVSLLGMALLAMELVEWKPPLVLQAVILLFSLVWYHGFRGVINGNAVILVALMITAALFYIKTGQDKLAGVFLAASTIKPHLVVLFIPCVLLWAAYHKRWKIIGWSLGAIAGLAVISLFLVPDWMIQNLREILRYPGYNPPGTLAEALGVWFPAIENQLKWGLGIVLGLIYLRETWKARSGSFDHFLWTSLLVLVIGQWIGIQTDPGNFILLFPAVVLILSAVDQRWPKRSGWVIGGILGVLFLGLWVLFLTTIERTYQPVQHPLMFIPLPAFCLVGMYWIKWWVIGSVRTVWTREL
jgi:hypothetical protein